MTGLSRTRFPLTVPMPNHSEYASQIIRLVCSDVLQEIALFVFTKTETGGLFPNANDVAAIGEVSGRIDAVRGEQDEVVFGGNGELSSVRHAAGKGTLGS